jgi:hypothetical protein
VTVIDDFGHHPTAIRETLKALRLRHGQDRIWAVFEPRSNTTRRRIFQQELAEALGEADSVVVAPVARLELLPPEDRLDPQRLIDDLRAQGRAAEYLEDPAAIVEHIARGVQGGEVVCVFSNGGFGGFTSACWSGWAKRGVEASRLRGRSGRGYSGRVIWRSVGGTPDRRHHRRDRQKGRGHPSTRTPTCGPTIRSGQARVGRNRQGRHRRRRVRGSSPAGAEREGRPGCRRSIGVAVSTGKGLVVPAIRNAERLSFAGIEKAIGDFAARARENQLRPEELAGGTFTISNGGVYGSLLSTPIINPPQSGILGLHAVQDRPVARGGEIVIRPMMYVALGYDHRIVDGREAVTFLRRVKELVESPARLLLEV